MSLTCLFVQIYTLTVYIDILSCVYIYDLISPLRSGSRIISAMLVLFTTLFLCYFHAVKRWINLLRFVQWYDAMLRYASLLCIVSQKIPCINTCCHETLLCEVSHDGTVVQRRWEESVAALLLAHSLCPLHSSDSSLTEKGQAGERQYGPWTCPTRSVLIYCHCTQIWLNHGERNWACFPWWV